MTDSPELPLGFPPPPDEADKAGDRSVHGTVGDSTPESQPAESARHLVDAIEALDHLLEERGDALVEESVAAEDGEDDYASPDVPLLLEVVRRPGEAEEQWQGSFAELDAEEQPDMAAAPAAESLQSQLIDELRQIIDDGLNRVAETTRAAVAQELKDQREVAPTLPADTGCRAALPSEMRTLAQAVDDALEKCGIGLGSHEDLYVDLLGELNGILRGGLDLIRRNMEATVRNRLQRHAEQTLRGLRQLRAEQQQEFPWPAPGGETSDPLPPTLEPYPDNGDNPGRPG